MPERLADVQQQLAEAEAVLKALQGHEVDAVIGKEGVALIRLREAEQAVRESEMRLRSLIESMPHFVWESDAEGRNTYASRPWREYSGLGLEETAGEGWAAAYHPDDRPRLVEAWCEALRTGRPYQIEGRVRRAADGAWRWHLIQAVPVRNGDDTITGWVGTGTDIHDRRKAEEALERQRELLQQVIDSIPVMLVMWDPALQRFLVNRHFTETLGWTHEDANAGDFMARVFPDPDEREAVTTYMRRLEPGWREFINTARDGKRVPGEWANVGLSDETRIGIGIDLRERRAAEEALRRSEERFRLLSEIAGRLLASDDPQAIVNDLCRRIMEHLDCQAFFNFLVDEPTGRLRLNACAGIPAEEVADIEWLDYGVAVCGCVARDQERITAGDIQSLNDPRTDLVRSYGIQAYCCHPLVAQGRLIGTLSFGTKTRPQFNDDEVELMRTVADQVSTAMQRVQAREDLEEMNARLEERVEERTAELRRRADQLARLTSELSLAEQRERRRLAQVLHDHLQQLLVGAKFGLQVMKKRLGDREHEHVEEVETLLDESLRASRSLTVELSPPILHEAGLGAGIEWLARWMKDKHGLEVEVAIDPTAATDREDVKVLLFQSAREALFNVVKHAGTTRARVELCGEGDDRLRLTIADSGKGFDADEMWARPRHMDGGFGLFSVRERLHLLGGRVEIESKAGEGASIALIAPAREEGQTAGAGDEAPLGRAATEAGAAPPHAARRHATGRGFRVLLVDDHAVVREGIAALLVDEPDIEIVGEAGDGREAVDRARALDPDVILMDFSMPVMDGVEATRAIHAAQPDIRIIGLSMYDEADRAAAMLEAGAAAYFTKSGEADEIIEAIRAE